MNHNADNSNDEDENNEIFYLLEAIDIDEIPAVNELGSKSEQAYFEKTVRVVDQANRFLNTKGRCY